MPKGIVNGRKLWQLRILDGFLDVFDGWDVGGTWWPK